TQALTTVQAYLPPLLDLIQNGQFETGNLSGWTVGGSVTPTITTTAHSGAYAAALHTGSGGDSTLQQSLFLSPTLNPPTLSIMYCGCAGASAPFTLTVSGDTIISQATPSIMGNQWTHTWLDLTPFVSQTITLTLTLQQPPGAPDVLLDEIEIGNADNVTL